MTSTAKAIKQLCLSLPDTTEKISHGFPSYFVNGKTFAIFSLNHHGDGKVALLINGSLDQQSQLVSSAPKHFFIPPYTGPKGWIGVELNQGLRWQRVCELALSAYLKVAPKKIAAQAKLPVTAEPTEALTPEDINPNLNQKNQRLIEHLSTYCLGLPEVSSDLQFGNPCYRAGKKTFCVFTGKQTSATVQIWVGQEQQVQLNTFDDRFEVPPYIGHRGWMNFRFDYKEEEKNWLLLEPMIEQSYRHFALKRMLAKLE